MGGPATTDAEARWVDELDQLEASIERFTRLALSLYDTTGAVPEVPPAHVLADDLGPVPPRLRARAEELAARADAAQTELHRARDVVGQQMAGLPKAPRPSTYHDEREPSFLDARG